MRNKRTRLITNIGMLAALAYILTLIFNYVKIQLVPEDFLRYDPKDIIIVMGGFIFGPVATLALVIVVPLLEFMTFSTTGWVGLVMNIVSSLSFAMVASLVYYKDKSLRGGIIGLVLGVLVATGMMLLWNYWITPIYKGIPRAAVAKMLIPVFLPFNLLKGTINASLTILLYKSSINSLRALGLIEENKAKGKISFGLIWLALIVLVFCVFIVYITTHK